jgi:hypothetical protein
MDYMYTRVACAHEAQCSTDYLSDPFKFVSTHAVYSVGIIWSGPMIFKLILLILRYILM